MQIHILCNLREGAWGGGNQFLKALRSQLIKRELYTEDAQEADIIIFNSFPFREEYRFKQIYKLKKQNKILIHRIDGPISQIRDKDLNIDKIIYKFNNLFADGTVFQSNWSKQENHQLGLKKNNFETTIINAPNSSIFNKNNRIDFNQNRKIKLIATSWSANPRKGFDVYKYLDDNLNFTKYEMIFIGNSPIQFKNIKWIKPLKSAKLAKQLKQHDIFITASQKDPCSNSLIEALHCGLPAIAFNDGGHVEIIGNAGEVFDNKYDIIYKLEKITNNYNKYQTNINLSTIEEAAEDYLNFARDIYSKFQDRSYLLKKSNILYIYKILFLVFLGNIISQLKYIFKKCVNKI